MRSRHLFQIRAYEPRDLNHVVDAANRAIRNAYAFFGHDHPLGVTRDRLIEALARGSTLWVPEANGAPAGVLGLFPNFVDKLFVTPEWQCGGIGTALLDFAKSIYSTHLELRCAQENHAACRFYEKCGFRPKVHRIADRPSIPEIVYRWEGGC
jgi:GNAT superfamily N-acetyltransferase